MSTDQNNSTGSTQFLNFSDALNHLRWGDRVGRRAWKRGHYVTVEYGGDEITLSLRVAHRLVKDGSFVRRSLKGHEIMAEDWYVLSDNQ